MLSTATAYHFLIEHWHIDACTDLTPSLRNMKIPEQNSGQGIVEVRPGQHTPAPDRSAENKLLWKLDIHIVPILTFLFLLAFLDRINIGNAWIQGMREDLKMDGRQYSIALFIFFIPYILFEVPCNLLLKRIAPSWWISGIMLCWGMLLPSLYNLVIVLIFLGYSEQASSRYVKV